MLPGFKSLKLYKGDTFAFNLALGAGGEDYPITDHIFTGQIKEKGKATKIAEFEFQITDDLAGELTVLLTSTESSKLNGSKIYEYDIQMDNNGFISTILKGPIVVVSDISN